MAEDTARERISVNDLVVAMGDRAFGALMLVFALPNVLPTPPGTSGLLGLPLVYLAAQLMLGQRPWLPKFIGSRSIRREDFAAFIERAAPWLRRAERLLRPRLVFLVSPAAERLVGAVCLVLAIVLFLPVPLGNMLPALSISVFSFGILGRDGLWVICGVLLAVISAVVAAAWFRAGQRGDLRPHQAVLAPKPVSVSEARWTLTTPRLGQPASGPVGL
uniref:ExoD n=1 Tax=EDTA-degrading bacterium BNC1 TaxID=85561 RepID=Q9F9S9_9PROT|nr:ExoD [EDTA-degrading bacterium BNC1]